MINIETRFGIPEVSERIFRRDEHRYTMNFGDGTLLGPWTGDQFSSQFHELHSYTTPGTYSYTFKVDYRERRFDALGNTISDERKHKNLIGPYSIEVVNIKYRTNLTYRFKKAASLKEAFEKCNAENGGEIFVANTLNNPQNHTIDLESLVFPVTVNVRCPDGLKINGEPVYKYYDGTGSMEETEFIESPWDDANRKWYFVTFNNNPFAKKSRVQGESDTWPSRVWANEEIVLEDFTHERGNRASYTSGSFIKVLPTSRFHNNSEIRLSIDPNIARQTGLARQTTETFDCSVEGIVGNDSHPHPENIKGRSERPRSNFRAKDIHVYPNPLGEFLFIEFDPTTYKGRVKFRLLDAFGKQLLEKYVEVSANHASYRVPIAPLNLSMGFYVLKLENEQGEIQLKKLMKNE